MKELIKKEVLRDMVKSRRWGGKHTELRNLSKGISNYILATRQGRKLFDKAVKELINSGWLFAKKSTGEIHVSLNPRYSKEILDFIESQ